MDLSFSFVINWKCLDLFLLIARIYDCKCSLHLDVEMGSELIILSQNQPLFCLNKEKSAFQAVADYWFRWETKGCVYVSVCSDLMNDHDHEYVHSEHMQVTRNTTF